MKHIVCIIVLLLGCASTSLAQKLRVSGTVKNNDKPVAGAIVSELNEEQRILNSAVTDAGGHFVMEVSSRKNKLSVKAEGFREQELDMNGYARFNFKLIRKIARPESTFNKHIYEESMNLFYGHNGARNIPQLVRVEMLTDTLVTITIPIAAKTLVEAYPADRSILFLDITDRRLQVGLSMEETYPVAGEPTELGHMVMSIDRSHENNYRPGDSESAPLYTYPQFLFSVAELEHLIDVASQISRIAIDTAAADNYWILYPDEDFAPTLQKILRKLQKKVSKIGK